MTPSCCMKLSWSMDSQCSTTLPLRTRMMSTNWSVTLFPVAGMPASSPVCVPVNVFFGYDLVALGDHVVDGES